MATYNEPPAPETIVIGSGVARTRRLSEGDYMAFRAYDGVPTLLRVERIMPYVSELVSSDLIVMSEADLRALFNFSEGLATDLAISVKNPRELTTIAAKIVQQFPDTRPILKSEILRTYDSIFDWRGGMMIVMLSVAVLCFVIFAWDKATGLSAEERKEIGILKAIGWETSDILLMKFWEGLAISLTAFLVGIALAYGHVFFTSSILFDRNVIELGHD